MTKCPWWDRAPAGLCDAAEDGWGMTQLPHVFVRAHARIANHDDGKGRCRVCGGPLDLDAFFDEVDRRDAERLEAS